MGLLSHLRQTQIATASAALGRHAQILDRYVAWLDEQPNACRQDRTVSLIARSPASPVARALLESIDELKARNVTVKAVLAQNEPSDALADLINALAMLSGSSTAPDELARWAGQNCLLDAHEQLILGRRMCWSGDAMRREPGKCDGLDLFEDDAPQTVRLGALAFEAIWGVCNKLPGCSMRGAFSAQLNASRAHPDAKSLAAFSFLGRIDRLTVTRH